MLLAGTAVVVSHILCSVKARLCIKKKIVSVTTQSKASFSFSLHARSSTGRVYHFIAMDIDGVLLVRNERSPPITICSPTPGTNGKRRQSNRYQEEIHDANNDPPVTIIKRGGSDDVQRHTRSRKIRPKTTTILDTTLRCIYNGIKKALVTGVKFEISYLTTKQQPAHLKFYHAPQLDTSLYNNHGEYNTTPSQHCHMVDTTFDGSKGEVCCISQKTFQATAIAIMCYVRDFHSRDGVTALKRHVDAQKRGADFILRWCYKNTPILLEDWLCGKPKETRARHLQALWFDVHRARSDALFNDSRLQYISTEEEQLQYRIEISAYNNSGIKKN